MLKTFGIPFLLLITLMEPLPPSIILNSTEVPIDSLKFLPVTEEYKGQWSDELLIGKK